MKSFHAHAAPLAQQLLAAKSRARRMTRSQVRAKLAAAGSNDATTCLLVKKLTLNSAEASALVCGLFWGFFPLPIMNHVSGVRNLHMAAKRMPDEHAKSICCSSGPPAKSGESQNVTIALFFRLIFFIRQAMC